MVFVQSYVPVWVHVVVLYTGGTTVGWVGAVPGLWQICVGFTDPLLTTVGQVPDHDPQCGPHSTHPSAFVLHTANTRLGSNIITASPAHTITRPISLFIALFRSWLVVKMPQQGGKKSNRYQYLPGTGEISLAPLSGFHRTKKRCMKHLFP